MIIIPLAGCTNGDETTTKTNTNPIVALQEDVDELNDNFNTEVANIKSRLSTLETSSIPANITNRVATLEANVAALQVTVNALSAGDSVDLTALTEAVNDIADDVLAAHSSIDAIRGDVNDINLDITDLKNKYNSITIPDYDSRIQEVELRIISILSSVQTYETEIAELQSGISDIQDDIDTLFANIDILYENELYLYENDLYLQEQIDNINADKVEITSINPGIGSYQVNFKINKTGNYAILFTIYSDDVGTITGKSLLNGYILTGTEKDYSYGASPQTMRVLILSPDSVKLSSAETALAQWTAGQTYSIQLNTAVPITCIDIDTGVR